MQEPKLPVIHSTSHKFVGMQSEQIQNYLLPNTSIMPISSKIHASSCNLLSVHYIYAKGKIKGKNSIKAD